ncbi:MAG: histidine phosphatase family protein [Lachnospiraceae bacterium]|nr:histidine phosphatase family protein [Lachnospiraceae bacterium]MBR0153798.1 histidine phosphatase family protein [Lachnospiraceae bacterium]
MLYLIRHGRTANNAARLLQGRVDTPLDELGEQQAAAAGEVFSRAGVHFAKIYSSPLMRAVRTAELAAPGVPVVTEERLLEMDPGPYEGMSLMDPAPEVEAFFSDFKHVPAPEGMESLEAVVERLGEFLEEIREEAAGQDILVSTHAIAMKGALEYLTPDADGKFWSLMLPNCGVYRAEVLPGGAYGVPEAWPERHETKGLFAR